MADRSRASIRRFLDEVHRDVVRLGPRDFIAVERLLRARPEYRREELGGALASLFASDQDQWVQVETLYRRHFLTTEGAAAPLAESPADTLGPRIAVVPVSESGGRRVGRWARAVARLQGIRRYIYEAPRHQLVGGLALASVAAIALPLWFLYPPTPIEQVVTTIPALDRVRPAPGQDWIPFPVRQVEPDRTIQVPVKVSAPNALYLLGGSSFLALLFGLRLLWLPHSAERARAAIVDARRRDAAAKRTALEEAQEPLQIHYAVEQHPALSRQGIVATAELLGRLYREEQGSDLDAPRTLGRTVRAGGLFSPVLEARRARRDLLVLVDVERGDHPWLGAFARVLTAWRSQGVVDLRYDFAFHPATLTEVETRRAYRIEDLARRTEGLPAIVFSRRLDPEAREGAAAWLDALAAWPARAWIDPNPRTVDQLPPARRHAVSRLATFGLQRFELSDTGVEAAARWLASEGVGNGPPARSPLPPIDTADGRIGEALRRWALAGALVPDPSWDQLEAIRRTFPEIGDVLPDQRYLQLLLDWVERETGRGPELVGGRGLDIPPDVQSRWIVAERRRPRVGDDKFEDRVRRLLLDQLAATEPSGALQREWWRFKRSMHQAVLEPERARELLAWVYASPVRQEAARWIDEEVARQAEVPLAIQFSQSTREAFSALSTGGSGVTPKELLWGLAHVWGRSVLVASAVAAALVALVFNYPPSVVGARNLPAMFALELEAPRAEVPAMVRLAGGEFSMGASTGASDEQPVHQVMVAPFEMSRTEVTMAEYRACVDAKVCREPGSGGSCNWGVAGRERHPVNCVSWDDANAFAMRLGMRLPTEAEWEFTARGGGARVEYPWGDATPDCALAVFSGCSDGTRPVCSIAAGATRQGLCDMAGNVWEWVDDDYHDSYLGAPTDARAWSDAPRGLLRVLRGGSWGDVPRSARVAYRSRNVPSNLNDYVGFRVARSLP